MTFHLTAKQRVANRLLTGPQRHTLLVGGSRSGKTSILLRAMIIRCLRAAASRHAIFRYTKTALQASIVADTLPKILRLAFPDHPYTLHREDLRFSFRNGSEIWCCGLDSPERAEKILGQEFATLYFNECSQIPYSSVLLASTRLAQKAFPLKNRAYYDLNPTGTQHWTYRLFFDKCDPVSLTPLLCPEDYTSLLMNPIDNHQNLDPDYLTQLATLPLQAKHRFLEGQYAPELSGALWPLSLLEQCRVSAPSLPEFQRIVVAVDPSGASNRSDRNNTETDSWARPPSTTGIVVAGLGKDKKGYVLADYSLNASPAEWGARAVEAFHEFQADRIVVESNFGGEMARFVLKTSDPDVPVKNVIASRGKVARAEPIAALYTTGKINHVAEFPALEAQMAQFTSRGYQGDTSPDRADALVWALTELMFQEQSYQLLSHLQ